MIRVYTAQTLAMVTIARSALEAQGIPCVLRNEFLSAGRGELPPIETWPELWVADEDQARAREFLAGEPGTAGRLWYCRPCAELVEGVFGRRWKRGRTEGGARRLT